MLPGREDSCYRGGGAFFGASATLEWGTCGNLRPCLQLLVRNRVVMVCYSLLVRVVFLSHKCTDRALPLHATSPRFQSMWPLLSVRVCK